MIEWFYIIISAIFSIVMIRVLPGIIYEILFFGTLISIIFAWHWEFTTFLGFPPLPEFVYKFGAGLLLCWILYRIILMVVNRTKRNSLARKITKFVFGKVEPLKLG